MNRALKKAIKADIKRIDQTIASQENGKVLYESLVAKYSCHEGFMDGLPPRTVEVLGVPTPNHHTNLLAIKGKLEMLLVNKKTDTSLLKSILSLVDLLVGFFKILF